jgi:hypothetical protein
MYTQLRCSSIAILMAAAATLCPAQSVTSARSGTLHYFEGDVSVDGTQLHSKTSKFPEIKEQSVLRTGKGRAEVLLTPGVFLRVAEDSAIRMLDTRLSSTRVDILSGSVMVESDDPQVSVKNSPVTLVYKDYEVRMVKHGLVEISSDPAQMKVFQGEAEVTVADNRAVVKDGRMLSFTPALTSEKFNAKVGDDLYLWARQRSESLSAANMSSARSINTGSGFSSGSSGWNGGWYFNPYFDMFTFVPAGGTYWSPFGFGYFSPATILGYYAPSSYWYGGAGARGTGPIGQPLHSLGSATRLSAPLSQVQNAGANPSLLGSPARGGNADVFGAGAAGGGFSAGNPAMSGAGARGGGVPTSFSAPAAAAGGGAAGGAHISGGPRGR